MSKRILITGAAGFLGSHLCDHFIQEDYQVIGMDNLIPGSLENIAQLFSHPKFEFHHHDVSNFIYVPGKLDYILHFASPASPIDYLKIPIQTLKVGSLGVHNCLGLAREKGARVLIASTSEVYGDPQVHPQNEDYWGPLARAESTTKRYDFRRRSRWPITEPLASKHALYESSTPLAHGCYSTMDECFPHSTDRHYAGKTSPSVAMEARHDPSVMLMT